MWISLGIWLSRLRWSKKPSEGRNDGGPVTVSLFRARKLRAEKTYCATPLFILRSATLRVAARKKFYGLLVLFALLSALFRE